MKNITFIILLFLPLLLFGQEYEPGKIVVKLNNQSPNYNDFGGANEYKSLQGLIGKHRVKPYIKTEFLNKVWQMPLSVNYRNNSAIRNVADLRIIEIDTNLSAPLIAAKIQRYDFIEYAEPVYKKEIVYTPNDEKFFEQYYLELCDLTEVWDLVDTTKKSIIAIVDTGVDYEHEDLRDRIFINQGEYGLDDAGLRKESNGIDDDNNGYIDDWRGWDFVSNSETGEDNDPYPGNVHGTHVAGTAGAVQNNEVGIAGAANNAIIMPVKIGPDAVFSRSTSRGYEAVFYAAAMGADIINCSWGSSGYSQSEQDIINAAVELGSVIIAAAGNDALDTRFFPASYDGVLSVASVNENMVASPWSNYNFTVDVAAPGELIYATLPLNDYGFSDGTSMAAPIVSGLAAMLKPNFPEYSNLQLIELIKAGTNPIDIYNPLKANKLGMGFIDALKTFQLEKPQAIVVTEEIISGGINDDFKAGDELLFKVNFLNMLEEVDFCNVKIYSNSEYLNGINYRSVVGYLGKGETYDELEPVVFTISEQIPINYELEIIVEFYDAENLISRYGTAITVNKSYIDVYENNISTTINSTGKLSFNDYPDNSQGIGFKYKDSENLLFESAVIITENDSTISNNARGQRSRSADEDFEILDIVKKNQLEPDYDEFTSKFEDKNPIMNVGVEIINSYYFSEEQNLSNSVILTYDLINQSGMYKDSIFLGMYMDWDIGDIIQENVISFDEMTQVGIAENINPDEENPICGVKLLSKQKLNFAAIDNNGGTLENPGVYDGFTDFEKHLLISNGIFRKSSTITDASLLIGAGPINLREKDTVRVSFLVTCGDNKEDLLAEMQDIEQNINSNIDIEGEFSSYPDALVLDKIFPNPVFSKNEITIQFATKNENEISIKIYDSNGRMIPDIYREKTLDGYQRLKINISGLSSGTYFLELSNGNTGKFQQFMIMR